MLVAMIMPQLHHLHINRSAHTVNDFFLPSRGPSCWVVGPAKGHRVNQWKCPFIIWIALTNFPFVEERRRENSTGTSVHNLLAARVRPFAINWKLIVIIETGASIKTISGMILLPTTWEWAAHKMLRVALPGFVIVCEGTLTDGVGG